MSNPVRALVSGASGFLGRALVAELASAGFAVTGLSRQTRVADARIDWLTCDMADHMPLSRLVTGFDVVINGAARTWNSSEPREARDYYAINRDAAVALFLAARRANVRAFVQISSTGVFGSQQCRLSETSPCRPENLYEQSKYEAELRLKEAAQIGDTKLVIVRPSNIFGGGHPRKKLLTWLRAVQRGYVVLASGNAEHWVNYVYVEDVTRAIRLLAEALTRAPLAAIPDVITLNVPATTRQFLEASAQALGVAPRAYVLPSGVLRMLGSACDWAATVTGRALPMTRDKARELTSRQVFCADRAAETLPGFPWFGLREGLRRTCDYYRMQGDL